MSDEVFILTTDTIQDYEGDIVRFPTPIVGFGRHEKTSREAYGLANDDLRKQAVEIGANAVLGAKYSDPEKDNTLYYVRVTGTPVYLSSPLMDPNEYIRNLKEQGDAE